MATVLVSCFSQALKSSVSFLVLKVLLVFNQIVLLSVNVDVAGSRQIGHRALCNMAGADKRPREMLIKMAASTIKSD